MRKKIFGLFLLIFAGFTLVACKEEINLDAVITEVSQIYSEGDSINSVTKNLVLVTKSKIHEEVVITWKSDNTTVISDAGIVTRAAADTVVNVTVTVKHKEKDASKTFKVTVKAKEVTPPPVDKVNLTLPEGVTANHSGEVAKGTRIVLTISIPEGKKLGWLKVNDVVVDVPGTSYEFSIQEDTIVTVKFEDETPVGTEKFTLTLPTGVTSDHDEELIVKDTQVVLTIAVPAGQELKSLKVNGTDVTTEVTTGLTYTFAITQNTVVLVEFKDIAATTAKVTLGSQNITANLTGEQAIGTSIIVTVAAPSGQELDELLVNGVKVDVVDNKYEFTLEVDVTITATFKTITEPAEEYELTLPTEITADHDEESIVKDTQVVLTIAVPAGQELKSLKVNGLDVTAQVTIELTYTFVITQNTVVLVEFQAIPAKGPLTVAQAQLVKAGEIIEVKGYVTSNINNGFYVISDLDGTSILTEFTTVNFELNSLVTLKVKTKSVYGLIRLDEIEVIKKEVGAVVDTSTTKEYKDLVTTDAGRKFSADKLTVLEINGTSRVFTLTGNINIRVENSSLWQTLIGKYPVGTTINLKDAIVSFFNGTVQLYLVDAETFEEVQLTNEEVMEKAIDELKLTYPEGTEFMSGNLVDLVSKLYNEKVTVTWNLYDLIIGDKWNVEEDTVATIDAELTVGDLSKIISISIKVKAFDSEALEERLLYSTGFEASDGFPAGTTYNNTEEELRGNAENEFGILSGNSTKTSPITDKQSVQIRWYSSTEIKGYIVNKNEISNFNKIIFNAKNTANVYGVKIEVSADGEVWTGSEDFTLSSSSSKIEYINSNLDAKFLKISLIITGDAGSNGKGIAIDDLEVYGMRKAVKKNIVTFDEGYEEAPINKVEVIDGEKVSIPEVPLRLNYVFKGWFEEGSEVAYDFDQVVTEDLTLTAKWELVKYTLTLTGEGLTSSLEGEIEHGTSIIITITIPSERNLKSFKVNNQEKIDEIVDGTFTFDILTNTNIVVTYELPIFEIEYNLGEDDTHNVIHKNPITEFTEDDAFSLVNPTSNVYEFNGWYETFDFSGEMISEITKGTTGNKVLYAKWGTPHTEYTVSTQEELEFALLNSNLKIIILAADIELSRKLLIANRTNLTIEGANFKLSLANVDGWKSEYIIHIYASKSITIKDIIFDGGDAAILVNASQVEISGLDLSNHEFGGIEVSKGKQSGLQEPVLTVNGNIEASLGELPVIWIDGSIQNEGRVLFIDNDQFEEIKNEEKTQVWFTMKEGNISLEPVVFDHKFTSKNSLPIGWSHSGLGNDYGTLPLRFDNTNDSLTTENFDLGIKSTVEVYYRSNGISGNAKVEFYYQNNTLIHTNIDFVKDSNNGTIKFEINDSVTSIKMVYIKATGNLGVGNFKITRNL